MRFFSRQWRVGVVLAISSAAIFTPTGARAQNTASPGPTQAGTSSGNPADTAAAKMSAEQLIEQLGDPEPTTREQALRELSRRGPSVREALQKAADSPRPAIADAARDLLERLAWTDPDDPPDARRALADYGQLTPPQRQERLRRLSTFSRGSNIAELIQQRRAVLRVLKSESKPAIAWNVLSQLTPDETWAEPLAQIDTSAPTALLMFKARHLRQTNDEDGAAALLEVVIDRELAEPTTPLLTIHPAAMWLVDRDRQSRRYGAAASRLRDMLTRLPEDDPEMAAEMEDALLQLHARHGPLPGLDADLSRLARSGQDVRQAVLMAVLCDRVGSGLGDILLDYPLAPRPDDTDLTRANRLMDAASLLSKIGANARAIPLFERVAAMPPDLSSTHELAHVAGVANLRLHGIYTLTQAYLKSAQNLENAMKRLDGVPLQNEVNGQSRTIPHNELLATLHWAYFKHAEQQKDAAAMKEHAAKVLKTSSTSGHIFIDVLPTLEEFAPPKEIDAYFDRVYANLQAQQRAAPDEPLLMNELAWLCARSGRRPEEGLKLAEEAVRRKPEEAAYLDTLAEAQFRLGRVQDAIATEKKALQHAPDDTFMQEQLARFMQAASTQPAAE